MNPSPEPQAAAGTTLPPNKGRLLLADDDPPFREMTRRLLAHHGYECDLAGTGAEAASCLRANDYDLLISDIDMPGNHDLRLVAELPQLRAGLPVILVTGAPTVDSAARSVGLAVAAYLIKPIAADVLLKHVAEAVERYRCFQAIVSRRKRYLEAAADLERIESTLRWPAAGTTEPSMKAFLELTFQNAAQSLLDLRRAIESAGDAPSMASSGRDPAPPAVLMQALWETIAVLERTKGAFKSKDLGQLRKKLEALIGGTPVSPTPSTHANPPAES